MMIAPLREAK